MAGLTQDQIAQRLGISRRQVNRDTSMVRTSIDAVQTQAGGLAAIDITAQRTMLELARLAYGDVAGFFTDDGRIKPISQLTADQRAMLSGYDVVTGNIDSGDGGMDRIARVRTWDKVKALEILAKHFGLMVERVDHDVSVTVRWQADDPPVSEPRIIDVAPDPPVK